MGTGKKKIEIKKITKESSRMVTFSKRRKGLFKKAQELQSQTGARVAIVVFSPSGRPYTHGDVSAVRLEDETSLSLATGNHRGGRGHGGGSGSSSSAVELECDTSLTLATRHRVADGISSSGRPYAQGETSLTPVNGHRGERRHGTAAAGIDGSLISRVENVNLEECDNVEELMALKKQLEDMKEEIRMKMAFEFLKFGDVF